MSVTQNSPNRRYRNKKKKSDKKDEPLNAEMQDVPKKEAKSKQSRKLQNKLNDLQKCLICTESVYFMAFGSCGHAICSLCALRLRFLGNDRRCTVCKQNLNFMLVIEATVGKNEEKLTFDTYGIDPSTDVDEMSLLLNQLDQGKAKKSIFDIVSGLVYVNCREHYESQQILRQFRCPITNCSGSGNSFRNAKELQKHFFKRHSGIKFCECCIECRPLFPSEHEVFKSHDSLKDHRRIAIHPKCKFCGTYFFDAQSLLAHMQKSHVNCFVCRQPHPQMLAFHRDTNALAMHCMRSHPTCKICVRESKKDDVVYEYAFKTRATLCSHLQGVHGIIMNSRHHSDAQFHNLNSIRFDGIEFAEGPFKTNNKVSTVLLDMTSPDPNETRIQLIQSKKKETYKQKKKETKRDTEQPHISSQGDFPDLLSTSASTTTSHGTDSIRSGWRSAVVTAASSFAVSTPVVVPSLSSGTSIRNTRSDAMLTAREVALFREACTQKSLQDLKENTRAMRLMEDTSLVSPLSMSDSFFLLSGTSIFDLSDDDIKRAMDSDVPADWTDSRLRVGLRRFPIFMAPLYPSFMVTWTGKNDTNKRLVLQLESRLQELIGNTSQNLNESQRPTSVQMRPLPSNARVVLAAYASYYNVNVTEFDPETGRPPSSIGASGDSRMTLSFIRRIDSTIPGILLSTASCKGSLSLPETLRENNLPRLYFACKTTSTQRISPSIPAPGFVASRQIFTVMDVLCVVRLAALNCIEAYRPFMRGVHTEGLSLEKLTVERLGLVRDVQLIGAGALFVEFDSVATAVAVYTQLASEERSTLDTTENNTNSNSFPLFNFFTVETGFSRHIGDHASCTQLGRNAIEKAVQVYLQRFPPITTMTVMDDNVGEWDPVVISSTMGRRTGQPDMFDVLTDITTSTYAVYDDNDDRNIMYNNKEKSKLAEPIMVSWNDSSDDSISDNENAKNMDENKIVEKHITSDVTNRCSATQVLSEVSSLKEWTEYLAAKRANSNGHQIYRAPTGTVVRASAVLSSTVKSDTDTNGSLRAVTNVERMVSDTSVSRLSSFAGLSEEEWNSDDTVSTSDDGSNDLPHLEEGPEKWRNEMLLVEKELCHEVNKTGIEVSSQDFTTDEEIWTWECESCTYINTNVPLTITACEMCGSSA